MSIIYINPYQLAAPWSPAEITTELWLDAADASTLTKSGGLVSQWDDKSGNGRNASQTDSTLRPAYLPTGFNGKPTIETDGGDVLDLGTTSLGRNVDGITAAIVGIHPVTASFGSNSNEVYISTSSANNTRFAFTPNPSASTADRYAVAGRRLDGDPYRTASSSTNSVANSGNPWIRVAQIAYSSGVANHWTNGTQDLTNGTIQTPGFTSNTDSISGSVFGGVTGLPNGSQLCEIVLTHSAMATADRQKLEGYLAHKWELTANLPAGHPYKNVAP